MPFFSSFLISFLLTLVLEYPIILLFRIQKKKDLLREIEELLEKYDRMPDFERKIEHY